MPDLIPIRYGRMAASPFAYFRGAAAPMAWDLAHTPTPDIRVQACGDAHLLNFGMYAAPDRRLVFDVNDFDETLPAPFDWDVKRLAASFAVAARDTASRTASPYRGAYGRAELSHRDGELRCDAIPGGLVFQNRYDEWAGCLMRSSRRRPCAAHRDIANAYRRTSLRAFLRMCDQVEGRCRLRQAHPVIVRFPIEATQVSWGTA